MIYATLADSEAARNIVIAKLAKVWAGCKE
jgi:hypothetical protein